MELPGAPEDEHCPAPIAGENDVINGSLLCRMEIGVWYFRARDLRGIPKLVHHSSGGTQKEERTVLLYISTLWRSCSAARGQGVRSTALPCKVLGADVW